jgi:RsiW-degrading membrane proteinase PrsW (M82 family)
MIITWATIEEICKYNAAYHGGLKRPENDEAVDDMIYLIAAALGFASIENALYVFGPLLTGDTELAIATGNLRFIGHRFCMLLLHQLLVHREHSHTSTLTELKKDIF